ncbi:MAG: zinc ribbon domain-containing protein [Clostridia bacterium]|nr:zinc ribbon domain-containing protein [Clostridia bacterium]
MFCKQCGSELKQGTNFCTMCGAKSAAEPVSQQTNNTNKNSATKELMKIRCLGKTTFNTQILTIYNDHITLKKDKITGAGDIIFDVKYCDIKCCSKKGNSIFLANRMYLDLKNGQQYDFSLDIRYDLKGQFRFYYKYYNPDMTKLYKTLPDYINNLIANYNA